MRVRPACGLGLELATCGLGLGLGGLGLATMGLDYISAVKKSISVTVFMPLLHVFPLLCLKITCLSFRYRFRYN